MELFWRFLFWLGRMFFGLGKLRKLELLPLESPLSKAIELYGDSTESEPTEKFPEARTYTFDVDSLYEVVVTVWKEKVREVTYWSNYASPNDDLRTMFQAYKGDSSWVELSDGYLYYRKDRWCQLWCSVMPAIGVGTLDFAEVKSAYMREQEKHEDNAADEDE